MRCPYCKTGRPKPQKANYHYTGCGLPNVYLKNVKWTICPVCGEITVEIPWIAQLHRCIGWMVVLKNSFLTGQEMIYLRKMLRKNQREMAEILGVGQVALNRWERETRKGHTKAMDSLFRMVYLALQDDEYTHEARQSIREALVKYLGKIKSEPTPLTVEIDPEACSTAKIFESMLAPIISKQGDAKQASAVAR